LNRIKDISGVSGVGRVAEGTQFSNGKIALCWLTNTSSIAIYDSIEHVETIHGHAGATIVEWANPDTRYRHYEIRIGSTNRQD
jgi:hypothetical protein